MRAVQAHNVRLSCNNLFIPGKISYITDSQPGSGGKGKLASFIAKNSNKFHFLVTTSSANASHTTVDGNKSGVFKILPSGSFYHEKIEAVYICAGASFEVSNLLREIKMTGIPVEKVKIHPRAGIITNEDVDYEKGLCDIDGEYFDTEGRKNGTIKTGTTASGSGANLMKKVIRNKTLVVAKDIPELQSMLCICEDEILERLSKGQSGLHEMCQGFSLSNNYWRFAPWVTSRNVTIGHALSDTFLPPSVVGNVILNNRCHPIRIHSKKYESLENPGIYLTWKEVKDGKIKYKTIESFSGDFFPDQEELTWEDIEKTYGKPIDEEISCTTLTKLPRRIATHSKINLDEAIKYNQTIHNVYIVYNFSQWVDGDMEAKTDSITKRMRQWMEKNVVDVIKKYDNVFLFALGTSENTDHYVLIERE